MKFLMRWLLGLFVSTLPLTSAAAQEPRRIAISFDDVPRQRGAFFTPDERSRKLIEGMRSAGVRQAVFFVTVGNFDRPGGEGGDKRIADYVAAGHVIANHSFSHPHLTERSAEEYLADLDKADRFLRGKPGFRPWFRFPYLDEGGPDKAKRDALRNGLAKRGLRNGYVTADGMDWHLEQLTINAAKDGKPMNMKALKRLYLQMHLGAIEYHDAMARKTLGRSPAHMLLLHETDLAALFLPDLVNELRQSGWAIISADEAYQDALREALPDVPYTSGTLPGMMAWEKKQDPPLSPYWIGESVATLLFKQRVLKEKVE